MAFADSKMFSSSTQFTNNIKTIVNYLVTIYKGVCPYDTGEMRDGIDSVQGITPKIVIGKDNSIKIHINIGDNVEYAGATQEKWVNRAGKNPNENWIGIADAIADEFMDMYFQNPKNAKDWLSEEWKNNAKIANNTHSPNNLNSAYKLFSQDKMEVVDE